MPDTKKKLRNYQFEIDGERGAYYFRFRAPNGEIMFHSENITAKSNCYAAIAIIAEKVAGSGVADLTKKSVKEKVKK